MPVPIIDPATRLVAATGPIVRWLGITEEPLRTLP